MAKNVWNATLDVNNDVKQNPFDWNHVNNLTLKIGQITPVFCDLVPAKTSFRVKNDFGLQLMPMVFPIQTRMRATISWFRYPLRALWKDYKDYVGNFREGLIEPYINFNTEERIKKMANTCSLGDYLGLPTTIVGDYGDKEYPTVLAPNCANIIVRSYTPLSYDSVELGTSLGSGTCTTDFPSSLCGQIFTGGVSATVPAESTSVTVGFNISVPRDWSSPIPLLANCRVYMVNTSNEVVMMPKPLVENSVSFAGESSGFEYYHVSCGLNLEPTAENIAGFAVLFEPNSFQSYVLENESPSNPQISRLQFQLSATDGTKSYIRYGGSKVKDITLSTSPYYSSISSNKEKQIKISAYAFRAYEGIYNCYIRDNRNNPYYIDGEVQYNQWIPSYEGGVDNNLYELRYANWEKDFLTTAVQSPQQGNAPLVGITTYETGRVLENGNLETKVALVDETGARYAVEFEQSEEGLENVSYVELDNGTRVRQARSLMDLASSGISIPDLRLVNCYQKYLELNMRKGYSYKDIIEGRFDVKVRYADLLQPEFFGGTSRNLNMSSISQTVDNDPTGAGAYKDVLGSQAGVGYFSGSNDVNIECFCDEESIIMGLLIITPLPVYTQLLPKHFTYRELLDHFNPEFNNLGFQPISYKEVCPIQAYNDNPDSLTKTFGYQRPWYEYCQRYDQAHGLFRTDLSNFLMHRVFNQKPELAQSFLMIDPEQVTDVFSVTDITDKIYGQVLLDITTKLPVARVAIPRLD